MHWKAWFYADFTFQGDLPLPNPPGQSGPGIAIPKQLDNRLIEAVSVHFRGDEGAKSGDAHSRSGNLGVATV
jgi:hypothetical protein